MTAPSAVHANSLERVPARAARAAIRRRSFLSQERTRPRSIAAIPRSRQAAPNSAKKSSIAQAAPSAERLTLPAPSLAIANSTDPPPAASTTRQDPASWQAEPFFSCDVPVTEA
jgi:hypothetical protein